MCTSISILPFFFFFNDTATTEIYTLSLHDALPIFVQRPVPQQTLRHQPGDYHGDAQWLRAELRAVRRIYFRRRRGPTSRFGQGRPDFVAGSVPDGVTSGRGGLRKRRPAGDRTRAAG